jgi:hypothetical protein
MTLPEGASRTFRELADVMPMVAFALAASGQARKLTTRAVEMAIRQCLQLTRSPPLIAPTEGRVGSAIVPLLARLVNTMERGQTSDAMT